MPMPDWRCWQAVKMPMSKYLFWGVQFTLLSSPEYRLFGYRWETVCPLSSYSEKPNLCARITFYIAHSPREWRNALHFITCTPNLITKTVLSYIHNKKIYSVPYSHPKTASEPEFLNKPKNRFQGTNSARLCSLAGRYDKPIPNFLLGSQPP